jgi:hypothetical protein
MPVFEQIVSLMAVSGWAKTRLRNAHNREGRESLSSLHETGVFAPFLRTEVMG